MRLRLGQTLASLLLLVSAAGQTPAKAANGAPAAAAKTPQVVSEDLGPISSEIAQSEYEIHWQHAAGAYMAPNRAQNLRFTFHDDGLTITPRKLAKNQPAWTATMRLESFGRPEGVVRRVGEASWAIAKNTAQDRGHGIAINYRNDQQGLRQEFLVEEKPPGDGPLRLEFGLERSGVNLFVDSPQNIMYFTKQVKSAQEVMMRYSDLMVFDANRQPLQARLVKEDADRFAIVVAF